MDALHLHGRVANYPPKRIMTNTQAVLQDVVGIRLMSKDMLLVYLVENDMHKQWFRSPTSLRCICNYRYMHLTPESRCQA